MIGEWENAWHFETPSGTLDLNTTTGYMFLLEASGCDAGVDLRVTEDNIPQGNGEIPHRAFTSGYKIRLLMQLRTRIDPTWPQAEAAPACDQDVTVMLDTLGLHINEILNQTTQVGVFQRLWWTPTGLAERMIDQIRLLERPVVTRTESDVTRVAFAVFTPFPYVISHADATTAFVSGGTHTIANAGTCDYYPVMKVYGPTAAFTITNLTQVDEDGNNPVIVYDSTLPGAVAIPAAHYVEINTFRATAYLDGNVASRMAGIDVQASDFFQIQPGGSSITITGAGMDLISADAWR